MRSIAWLLCAAPLLVGSAHAAEVYKCSSKGSTVYQDMPCNGAGEKLKPATGSSTTAGGLAQQIADANAELYRVQRELSDRRNTELDQTRARLGLRKAQALPLQETRRVDALMEPMQQKVRDARALVSDLTAEAARRCPGGFSSGGKNGAVCRTK